MKTSNYPLIKVQKLHLSFLTLLLFLSSCNYSSLTPEQLAQNQIDKGRYRNFNQKQKAIQMAIYSNEYKRAKILIDEIRLTEKDSEFGRRIDDLQNFYSDRRLFVKIFYYKQLNDIDLYQNNSNYFRYKRQVQIIKSDKEHELYLQAINSNSINDLSEFLESYPQNESFGKVKQHYYELIRQKEKDSIENLKKLQISLDKLQLNAYDFDVNIKTYSLHDYYVPTNYHYENNYVNPNSSTPVVKVEGYYRSNGTYVEPYVRTAPNNTTTDNLRYRKL